MQAEIDAFETQQAELAWQDDRVKLLMTIPGVTVSVATALVAAFGDIRRFRTPDAAASYLGLTPSTRQSGNSAHHGPITKRGNSTARWKLASLRITATGEKSRGGNPKGSRCAAGLPEGSRTIRSLDDVCRNEDLPPRSPLASREQRAVRDSGTLTFIERIAAPQVIPRKPEENAHQQAKNTSQIREINPR